MDYFSIWPSFVVLALIWALASTPLLRLADSPPIPTASRIETLDGLRGFLALGVFLHHTALYHDYLVDRVWTPPTSHFYAVLGPAPVSMFFMITGFLFWSQVVAKKGRPDWIRLYIGRVFRIGPIYLSAVLVMLLLVGFVTHFRLAEAAPKVAKEIAEWLALGAVVGTTVNGYSQAPIFLAKVTWSLSYEWYFYASLLLTAYFARGARMAVVFPAVSLVASLAFIVWRYGLACPISVAAYIALFSAGMLTASLRGAALAPRIPDAIASAWVLIAVLTVFLLFPSPYGALPLCLMASAFFMIANGATLFGILTTRAARRLGDVSFGIYLLQGFVLAATFAFPSLIAFEQASPLGHWLLTLGGAVGLILVATAAHVLIERPGVDLGRAVANRIRPKP